MWKRNDALKLFLAWREKGDAGWARLVENYIELADYLANEGRKSSQSRDDVN